MHSSTFSGPGGAIQPNIKTADVPEAQNSCFEVWEGEKKKENLGVLSRNKWTIQLKVGESFHVVCGEGEIDRGQGEKKLHQEKST